MLMLVHEMSCVTLLLWIAQCYYCYDLHFRFYVCFVCQGISCAVCTENQNPLTNKGLSSAIGNLI